MSPPAGRPVEEERGQPLITVAITCYNAEDTIRRAVESAIAQTWPKREIIVVDDCSSDRSRAVLRELERAHQEVSTTAHDVNRGVAAARNTVLEHARGDYIAFFDDDDVSAPHRLARQYRKLMAYASTVSAAPILCYSDREVRSVDERPPLRPSHGIGRVAPEPSGSIVADYVLGLVRDDGIHSWGMLGCGTLMARTEDLRLLGGFDMRFRRCEELDLAVRAAHRGAHFISVDEPLLRQYVKEAPKKGGQTALRYRLLLLKKHKAYLVDRHAYLGAQCIARAQSYRGRYRRWRLWYVVALFCFPLSISRKRLRRSTSLARFRLPPTRSVEP